MEFDPQFPNRPQHPDFFLAAEKVRLLDEQTSGLESVDAFNAVCARIADPSSIDYLSEQRAGLMIRHIEANLLRIPEGARLIVQAMLATAWGEGFYVGNMYSGAKQAEAFVIPDNLEGLA